MGGGRYTVDFRSAPLRSRYTPREPRSAAGRCPRCGERLVNVAGRPACIVAACRLKNPSPTTKEHQP